MIKLIHFLYKNFLKKLLFLLDPELTHNIFLNLGSFFGKIFLIRLIFRKIFKFKNSRLEQDLFGLKFVNPVGLAAGFDKDARITNIISDIGFGHSEVGTATYKPYKGNPKPRLLRLIKDVAILVNYGFKNSGIKKIANNIAKSDKKKLILGLSIGKTNNVKTTDLKEGIVDQLKSFKLAKKIDKVDFLTLNISCPNTFGGQPFTSPERFEKLLKAIRKLKIKRPLFVKMPINLKLADFDKLLKLCVKYKVSAVVIGNLNKNRKSIKLKSNIPDQLKGGLSGKPTEHLSDKLIEYTYKNFGKKIKIIGVGGIFYSEEAYRKIKLGASLVQLITGMIYEGPQLVSQINRDLVKFLEKDGFKNIKEAVGRGTR